LLTRIVSPSSTILSEEIKWHPQLEAKDLDAARGRPVRSITPISVLAVINFLLCIYQWEATLHFACAPLLVNYALGTFSHFFSVCMLPEVAFADARMHSTRIIGIARQGALALCLNSMVKTRPLSQQQHVQLGGCPPANGHTKWL